MKNSSCQTWRLVVGLGAGLAATSLYADDPATKFSIEAGPAWGQVTAGDHDGEVLGFAAGAKWEVGKLLISKLSLRGDYLHLESQDDLPFERDEVDVDARLTFSLLGFISPYASAGLSVVRNDSATYTPNDDWTPGYGLGAGVGITLVPGLLHTTPSVRFAQFEDLETITYGLDTTVHIRWIGVGVRVNYEDNLSRDGHIISGVLYGSLRF